MEKPDYRAWFESTRESNQATIDQTETIFEGLVLKIASGAMAISFSFITALAPKIEYRFWWILAVGWIALAVCIIPNEITNIHFDCDLSQIDVPDNIAAIYPHSKLFSSL